LFKKHKRGRPRLKEESVAECGNVGKGRRLVVFRVKGAKRDGRDCEDKNTKKGN